MTTHPDLYAGLKGNRGNLETMNQIENRINQSNNNYFIPCSQIDAASSLIQSGDIIFFTTNIPGLDVAHAGIAYWNEGQLCMIHASSTAKKVIVSDQSLSQYCRSKKSFTGIIVLRTLPMMFDVIESDESK
jgi:cell wall-associated NlpC family hydrolase